MKALRCRCASMREKEFRDVYRRQCVLTYLMGNLRCAGGYEIARSGHVAAGRKTFVGLAPGAEYGHRRNCRFEDSFDVLEETKRCSQSERRSGCAWRNADGA